MDVNIALQLMHKRIQHLSLLSLSQAEINHLTLRHQAFVFGVVFCDPRGLSRLAGSSGTQGRFALACDIDFCEPTGLSHLTGSSGT